MSTDRRANTSSGKCHAKGSRKLTKYKIQRRWNMKCMMIPVITEATGIVKKVERKIWKPNQENIQWIPYKNCFTWNITRNRENTAV
jgi:hypothetical protein